MMNAPHVTNPALDRRHLLKGIGTCIALPLLEAMVPSTGSAAAKQIAKSKAEVPRFVAMNAGLGFHAPFLFPEAEGSSYTLTPYLEQIKTTAINSHSSQGYLIPIRMEITGMLRP